MDCAAFERLGQEKQAAILRAGIEEFSARSYTDANTDRITAACGISKGLLYHYFGTKKGFYLYCVNRAMETLTAYEPAIRAGDFYAVLFASMEEKMELCVRHPGETRLINLAAREGAAEVAEEKNRLLSGYAARMQQRSQATLRSAVAALRLKLPREEALEALTLYSGAVMGRYLAQYQNEPGAFFKRKDEIKQEIRRYLDRMLYGLCEEEQA